MCRGIAAGGPGHLADLAGPMQLRIGVDLDNTLVGYDHLFHRIASDKGLIRGAVPVNKRSIRDAIRALPDGEREWQQIQAVVYTSKMNGARLIDGAVDFLWLCKSFRVRVFIISHKTRFANYDETGTDLRNVAFAWMRNHGFFGAEGLGLSPEDVYFESTRGEKIQRIKDVKCTHFIDDLEEVLLDESFPHDVEKILYGPGLEHSLLTEVKRFAAWKEIGAYFFGQRR